MTGLTPQERASLAATCSRCGGARDREGQRLCRSCHAQYQREWKRKRTRQFRAAVRANSRHEKAAGRIQQEPCTICGDPNSEFHHPDHEMSALTVWLCRRHHMFWHDYWKHTVLNIFCDWIEIARECDAVRQSEDAADAARKIPRAA